MSAADWYARKLGGASAPAGRQGTPQVEQMLVRHTPAPPGYLPPGQAVVGYEDDETQPSVDAPAGQMRMGDAIMRWRGGKGTKTETQSCPSCGGKNYFSRSSQAKATQNGLAPPAPTCFDCGFNGIYFPFGGDLSGAI